MKSLRAQLAADPAIGAGNVLATVIAHGADPQGPGLTFDTAVDHFPAEHPLTLGELDERVQARTAWLRAHGIGRRDVVAIWATEAADIVLSFLALTRVGAIPALMNGKMAPARDALTDRCLYSAESAACTRGVSWAERGAAADA